MKRIHFLAVFVFVLFAALISAPLAQQSAQKPFVPVQDELLWKPDPADWLSWRRTLDGQGYSPLTEINRNNVRQMRMMWTRPLNGNSNESTPLVYKGIMYVPNSGDVIQAYDAKTGALLWEYKRPSGGSMRNRTMTIYGTMLLDASGDNQIYAIDAQTGKLVWETAVLPPKAPASATGGPIIANGKVVTGRQCQPGAGTDACIVTAHDAMTGKEVWRFRTIPRPGEPGNETWGDVPENERWHVGTWMIPSYDPETNLVLIGTSVTIPAPKFVLGGNDKQHLYHNSTLALNADTGKLVWYYQHLVDHWDLDHPFERVLADVAVAPDPKEVPWINPRIKPGERRKVVTGIPGKTGLIYTLDRQTGEFLWARPTVMQNVISSIDGATGKVNVNPAVTFSKKGESHFVCPSASGGKNWPAGAFNPQSNVMFYPLQNLCMNATTTVDTRDPKAVYGIQMPVVAAPSSDKPGAPPTDKIGSVWAVSAETGKTMWKFDNRAGMLSLVATAGGLVMGGDAAGVFRAWDDRSGKVLFEVNLNAPVSGYPISYAVDGKQYVAVPTGGSLVSGSTNRLTPEFKPSNTSNLYIFALP